MPASRLEKVDSYISKLEAPFDTIIADIRLLAHDACPQLEESIKWSMPCLSYKGIVAQLAGFKNHARLAFWKGSLLDSDHLTPMGASKQMCGIRIESTSDVPDDAVLIDLFRRAVDLNERGIRVKKPGKVVLTAPEPPDWFIDALKSRPPALDHFHSFSPSQQREYVEWMLEAKRETTRLRRLEQAVEWLSEGKPRNWKYMNC